MIITIFLWLRGISFDLLILVADHFSSRHINRLGVAGLLPIIVLNDGASVSEPNWETRNEKLFLENCWNTLRNWHRLKIHQTRISMYQWSWDTILISLPAAEFPRMSETWAEWTKRLMSASESVVKTMVIRQKWVVGRIIICCCVLLCGTSNSFMATETKMFYCLWSVIVPPRIDHADQRESH